MKDITSKLIALFKDGYCAPRIAQIAKKLHEPSSTIHYNIKKLERQGAIKAYKAVFNYKEIGEGHCTYLLVRLTQENYADPERIGRQIAKNPQVESVDVCTGEYELLIKIRFKDVDEYYNYIRDAVKRYGFEKAISLNSLKQVKTEFVAL